MAGGSVHGGGRLSGGSSSNRSSSYSSHRSPSSGGSHSSNSGKRLPDNWGHGHGYRRPPHRYHMFGREVVYTSGTGMFFGVIIFLLVAVSIILAISIPSKHDLEARVSLYEYYARQYEEICEKANNNVSGFHIFEFKNIDSEQLANGSWIDPANPLNTDRLTVYEEEDFTHNGVVLYFIEYSFEVYGHTITETTYSTYSASDIRSMTSFKVAYVVAEHVTSINADYKLSENYEYLYEVDNLNSQKTLCNVMICIVSVLGAILVLGVVVIFLKSKKVSATPSIVASDETVAPKNEPSATKKEIYCAYCGAILDEKDKRCSSCGAKRTK